MFESVRRSFRDAADIARRANGVGEVVRALMPPALLQRRLLNPEPSPGVSGTQDASVALRKLCNRLKADAIDEAGRVDYARLRDPSVLAELERTAGALHAVHADAFEDDSDRIAFWLNLYNVLAIHGVIAVGVLDSVMERPSFFSTIAYQVGSDVFTLDEMENGVLRRNAAPPAKRRLFRDGDPRLSYCPTKVDPRIHAALVCCSASCPAVAFYEPARLDQQLRSAAEGYVSAHVRVDHEARCIYLPITFDYYAKDWGSPDDIQQFLLQHADGDLREDLQRARNSSYAVDFERYDWSLNAT